MRCGEITTQSELLLDGGWSRRAPSKRWTVWYWVFAYERRLAHGQRSSGPVEGRLRFGTTGYGAADGPF